MRLDTLLHELCRVYLSIYTCKQCPSKRVLVDDLNFHGVAWQRLAFCVEYAARHQLGLAFELTRFCSIQGAWDTMHQ